MEEHIHGENCNHDHEGDEELSTEEVVDQNDILLNALIDLLITKGVITEDEFNTKVTEFATEDEDESEESDTPPGEF